MRLETVPQAIPNAALKSVHFKRSILRVLNELIVVPRVMWTDFKPCHELVAMAQRWGGCGKVGEAQRISYNYRDDAVLVTTARKFTECQQLFSHYY